MSYETIKFLKQGSVGVIQLNRPERMNAVIEEMYREIQDVLKSAQDAGDIRSLILTGSVLKKGDVVKQAFCAGADLKKHSSGERIRPEASLHPAGSRNNQTALRIFKTDHCRGKWSGKGSRGGNGAKLRLYVYG